MNNHNDFEKTLKKYAKPQLLAMEKTIKQGFALACATYLVCLIGDFSGPFKTTFSVFILYNVIVGGILCYKIQRAQILEDDTTPAEICWRIH